jgi:hypothetical protein
MKKASNGTMVPVILVIQGIAAEPSSEALEK